MHCTSAHLASVGASSNRAILYFRWDVGPQQLFRFRRCPFRNMAFARRYELAGLARIRRYRPITHPLFLGIPITKSRKSPIDGIEAAQKMVAGVSSDYNLLDDESYGVNCLWKFPSNKTGCRTRNKPKKFTDFIGSIPF